MLENEHIVVTTAAAIDLERVLLHTNTEDLPSLSELKYLVAPLVCRNKEDQETVYKILEKLDAKIKDDYIIPGVIEPVRMNNEEKGKPGTAVVWRLKECTILIADILAVALLVFFILTGKPVLPEWEKLRIQVNPRQVVVNDTVRFIAVVDSSLLGQKVSVDWKIKDTSIYNSVRVSKVFYTPDTARVIAYLRNAAGAVIDSTLYPLQILCEPPPSVSINETNLSAGNGQAVNGYKRQFAPLFINPSADSIRYTYKWYVDDSLYSTSKVLNYARAYNSIRLVVADKNIHCSLDSMVAQVTSKPSLGVNVQGDGTLRPQKRFNWNNILLSVLLLLLVPGIIAFLIYRRIADVQEPKPAQESPGTEGPYKIEFESQQKSIEAEQGIKKLADVLRKRQVSEIYKLNLRQTIRSTIVGGGIPALQFTPLSKPMSFLVFIDKEKPGSHLVKLFEYLADDLHKNEVDLQVYEYFKEPLFLTNEKLNHHRIPLAKVATLYPDTTLFIFGEARYFLYPLKGTVKDWVSAKLNSWQTKILITPFAKDDWDKKEKLLMDSGLVVLPADLSSLPVIDKIINKQIDTRDQKKEGVESPYRSRSLNFQELETLKEYLVEDKLLMQWVCSTAVYPALDWNLLLALGKAIEQQRGTQADLVTYSNLLKISRISWMQDGLISESLRAGMLDYLSDDEEALARETLQQQLQQIENTIDDQSLIKPQFDIHKKLNRFLLHSYNNTKPSAHDEAFISELVRTSGLDEGQDIYLKRDNSLLRHPFDKGRKIGLASYFKIKRGRLKSLSVGTALFSFLSLFLVGFFLLKNNSGLTQWADNKPVDQTYNISINGSGVGQQIMLHLYYEPGAEEPARESWKLENSSDTLQFKAVSITDTTGYGRLQILTADGQTIADDSFKLNSNSYQITISEVPKVPLTIYYRDTSSLTLATGIAENLPYGFNVSLRQDVFKDMGVAGIQYFSESDAELANGAAATVSDLLKTTVTPQLINTSPEYQDGARVKIFVNQPQAAIPISKKALPKSLGEIWRGGTSNRLISIDLSKQIIYYSTGDKKTYGTYYVVEAFLSETGSYRVVTRADKQHQVFFFKNVRASSFELSVCQNRYNTVQEARTVGESYCDRFNRMSLYYENDPRKIYLPVYGNKIERSNQAKIDIINDSLTGLRNVPLLDVEGTLLWNIDFVPVPPALQFPFAKPLTQLQRSSTPFDRNYLQYKLSANKPTITPQVTYGDFGINNHLLYLYGKPVSYEATPNKGGPYVPQYIIINSTSTTSAKATIKWFTNPEANSSTHLLIDRDGNITQFAPFNIVTFHAGASNWKGLSGLNKYAIGIELVNGGRLRQSGDKWFAPTDRQEIPGNEIFLGIHKNEKQEAAWHTYTQQQIDALTTICKALQKAYDIKDVLGHDDIAPKRKTDPGPAFPMQKLRADVFGSKSGK